VNLGVEFALPQKFIELARGYRQIGHRPCARSIPTAEGAKAIPIEQSRAAFRAERLLPRSRVALVVNGCALRLRFAEHRAKNHCQQNPDSMADKRD
jgi:hypothetical protein